MSSKPKDGLFCNYHLKVLKFSLSTFLGFFEVQFTKTTIFSGADRIVFLLDCIRGMFQDLVWCKIAADDTNGGHFNLFFPPTTSDKK